MLLFELCDTPGVSSSEDAVRDLLARCVRPYVDDLQVDSIGNLMAFKRGTAASAPKLLLSAHMDEAGWMVTRIKEGTVTLGVVGQGDPRYALSKRVLVGPDQLPGVLAAKPAHHTGQERDKMPDLAEIPLEMAGGGEHVKLGQTVAFAGRAELLGQPVSSVQPLPPPETLPSQGRVKAKALLSRAGCALLAELLRSKPQLPYDLWVAFTVQEQVGLRGAQVVANRIQPDLALAVGGAPADDGAAGAEAQLPSSQLGQGVILSQRHPAYVVHPGLYRYLLQVCERHTIRWQPLRTARAANEGRRLAQAGGGRPVATVMLPVRYASAPIGIMDLEDYAAAAALIRYSVLELSASQFEAWTKD